MASKISGVGVHTIRAWEKRYKALIPNRDSSGHRTYTKTDIEKLMLLSELCLLGYTISKVAKLEIPELKNLLKDLGKNEESMDAPEFNLIQDKPSIDIIAAINILLFALKAYKLDVVNQELIKLRSNLSSRDMAINIILPLTIELKELANSGRFTIIQVETVTRLLYFHCNYALYRQIDRRERNSLKVLVAGLDGSNLDLDVMIVGLLCNHYGLNFTFFDSGNNYEAILDSITFLDINLLILSNQSSSLAPSVVEKIMGKTTDNLEIILSGKTELGFEKIPSKRFSKLSTFERLDEYLSKKL
jgi:DNA-binding transcriptional MerR regulator